MHAAHIAKRLLIGGIPDVPYIETDAEAERLFGPSFRGVVSAFAPRPVDVFFAAGECSRCKAACSYQRVRVPINVPGKVEALCSTCMGHDAEARQPDWFASEERATR
jgi:hypothetical protein